MNQEVVVSPGTLFEVLKGYDILDLNSDNSEFFKHLQSDKLCLDTSNVILDALLYHIKSDGGPEVMQLWSGLVQYINQVYYDVKPESTKEKGTLLYEEELAKKSSDHIWIKKSWDNNQETRFLNQKLNHIFYCSLSRYLKPENQDLILRNGRIISLKKGDRFPLISFLTICMKGSDILEIRDGYIVTSEFSKKIVRTLINGAKLNCKIKIYTFDDDVRSSGSKWTDKYKVEKFKEYLVETNPRKDIEFIYLGKKNLHDRSIKTQDWFIALGAGLDRHDGNKIRKETTISISRNS